MLRPPCHPPLTKILAAKAFQDFSAPLRLTGNDFSQVVFEWRNGKATAPQWLTIEPKVAQALIERDLQELS